MALYEKNALLTCKDEAGNKYLLYPITRLDCVDGADDLLHYGSAQELTDEEKAQARENIGAIPAPIGSKVGQLFRVAAVDAYGGITAVETIDWSSASVSNETLTLS